MNTRKNSANPCANLKNTLISRYSPYTFPLNPDNYFENSKRRSEISKNDSFTVIYKNFIHEKAHMQNKSHYGNVSSTNLFRNSGSFRTKILLVTPILTAIKCKYFPLYSHGKLHVCRVRKFLIYHYSSVTDHFNNCRLSHDVMYISTTHHLSRNEKSMETALR